MIHSGSIYTKFSLAGLILNKAKKEDLYSLQSDKPKVLFHYKAECDFASLLRFIPL